MLPALTEHARENGGDRGEKRSEILRFSWAVHFFHILLVVWAHPHMQSIRCRCCWLHSTWLDCKIGILLELVSRPSGECSQSSSSSKNHWIAFVSCFLLFCCWPHSIAATASSGDIVNWNLYLPRWYPDNLFAHSLKKNEHRVTVKRSRVHNSTFLCVAALLVDIKRWRWSGSREWGGKWLFSWTRATRIKNSV